MMALAQISVEFYSYLSANGIEIYVGNDDEPSMIIDMEEEVSEFLEDMTDEEGKVYEGEEAALDSLILQFQTCLKLLENAKR